MRKDIVTKVSGAEELLTDILVRTFETGKLCSMLRLHQQAWGAKYIPNS